MDFAVEENLPNLKRFSKEQWTSYSYGNVTIYGHEFGKNIPVSVYRELALDVNRINIVVLHGQVAEYRAKDGAPVISLPKFENQNIDYIALGHIHDYKMEKLDRRCVWCYPGCLEGRGFDECGEKGFVLLDAHEDKLDAQFIPIAKRVIHEVPVTLSGTLSFSHNGRIYTIRRTFGLKKGKTLLNCATPRHLILLSRYRKCTTG